MIKKKKIYSCCKQDENSTGCIQQCDECHEDIKVSKGCQHRQIKKEYWLCCSLDKDSKGCEFQCISCQQFINMNDRKQGCIARYECCKKNKEELGCQKRYSCCLQDIRDTDILGCSYQCCQQKINLSMGCKERFTCCNCIVGTTDPNQDGCLNEWTCCEQKVNEQNKGCKLQWECCQVIVSIEDPNNENQACTKYCLMCNAEWGNSKFQGCVPFNICQHEMIELKRKEKKQIPKEQTE